jgi:hypothetical protein
MSKAKQLAAAIYDRISGITVANGYLTNIGQTVFRGKRTADEKDVPMSFIVEGDDEVLGQKSNEVRIAIPFAVEGHTTCDPDNPNDAVHDIVSDLKKAIFSGDRTFGGLVRATNSSEPLQYMGRTIGEREDGAKVVGAAILFKAEIVENLSNP